MYGAFWTGAEGVNWVERGRGPKEMSREVVKSDKWENCNYIYILK